GRRWAADQPRAHPRGRRRWPGDAGAEPGVLASSLPAGPARRRPVTRTAPGPLPGGADRASLRPRRAGPPRASRWRPARSGAFLAQQADLERAGLGVRRVTRLVLVGRQALPPEEIPGGGVLRRGEIRRHVHLHTREVRADVGDL